MDPVECQHYTDYIPDYTERELARLHAGRYSSLPHFEVYGLADQACTYVARRDDQATALLLYRREAPPGARAQRRHSAHAGGGPAFRRLHVRPHRQPGRSGLARGGARLDAAEEERVMRMLSRCGLVGVLSIDGRCCAGSICYRTGDVVSGRFLGHDPAYDTYRLGFLCAYLMCAACAGQGDVRKFNFG